LTVVHHGCSAAILSELAEMAQLRTGVSIGPVF
jgi:hypothetical protein